VKKEDKNEVPQDDVWSKSMDLFGT